MIHPTAIISSKSKISKNVKIGPYCIIDENVSIDENTEIISNVHITGRTKIGKNNKFFPFSSIGNIPQDLKYSGEESKLIIGNNNVFREHTTINPGTSGGGMITKIDDNCLFMIGTHIAHDCNISSNVIMSNNATLAGHVTLKENVIIGGLSAVHQFVTIGKYAMIGGMSGVENNIIPYGLYYGIRKNLRGLNLIGLKRKGLDKNNIQIIQRAFNIIFDPKESITKNIEKLKQNEIITEVSEIIDFIKSNMQRGVCRV
ncbi:MAG: Acyl-[acyl-carrier-protein]--UDP-N-acetylglucosamine O-acyltransferase [Alphaproteobacteria bacterium MarineAlpha5_Bin9]|nr:MAG: Acyl-[acyl-carrier-protein]--UDP-N-acetylglucosamine O-acyltransferase [Alphaproteobacteria bacterium MarineAlpha5_Bin9]|tara:strand:- start:13485 stop:14258 length:774 start_codon:yes stop_codon:yes gene_type:complete